MQNILEAGMLLSFSLGWYMSILKMLRTGKAVGKSTACVALVCFGYGAGLSAKLIEYSQSGTLNPIFWFYAWNGLVTAFDLFLVVMLTRRAAGSTRLA